MINPVACVKCANSIKDRIEGLDPREWIKEAAEHTVKKCIGKSPKEIEKHFINRLEKNMKKAKKDISNPKAFAEKIWKKLKHKCT